MGNIAIGIIIGIVGTLAVLWGALAYTARHAARQRESGPWGPEVRVADDFALRSGYAKQSGPPP